MQYLTVQGVKLAYHHTSGRGPGIMFCNGFTSDMTSTKAVALERWALSEGLSFTRFDYSGHGASSEDFFDGTIGIWHADSLAIFDHVTSQKQIIVGSSMGGWMMVLLALARRERVVGLVGIAAAPDFTEDLVWDTLDEEQRQKLIQTGLLSLPCTDPQETEPLTVTYALITEGRHHLVLRKAIPLTCPVRLLHGMRDTDVPWQTSIRLLDALDSTDCSVTLIKDGTHRLSREQDIQCLTQTVADLVGQISVEKF